MDDRCDLGAADRDLGRHTTWRGDAVNRRPIASVTTLKLPHLHPDAVRIEVACPASTTGITHVPGPVVDVEIPTLITMAVVEHEARCEGDCDTSFVHAQGDEQAREIIETLQATVQTMQARRYASDVRN
jgi:hypothetical protein